MAPNPSLDTQAGRGGLLATPVRIVESVFSGDDLARLEQEMATLPLVEWWDHVLVNGRPARQRNVDCLHLEVRLPVETFGWVHRRLWGLMRAVNADRYGFEVTEMESLRYLVYRIGDQYHWHHDQLATMVRKISITIQLSDPGGYTGAEFQVMPPEATCPNEAGTAIILPATFVHRITPLRTGERRALVARFVGPPLR